jgi:hypothetical protein
VLEQVVVTLLCVVAVVLLAGSVGLARQEGQWGFGGVRWVQFATIAAGVFLASVGWGVALVLNLVVEVHSRK